MVNPGATEPKSDQEICMRCGPFTCSLGHWIFLLELLLLELDKGIMVLV